MQINYIILAHDNPSQLFRLVQRLSKGQVHFYIHIDLKSDFDAFRTILSESRQVTFIDNRINCIWGDISMIHATLNCMNQIIADQRTGYAVLLSGQDYPLKSNEYIARFFNKNYGANFINIFSLPTANWKQERDGMDRVEHYKFNVSDQRYDFLKVPPLLDSDLFKQFAIARSRALATLNKNLEILMKPRVSPSYIEKFYGGSQWWAFPIETIRFIVAFLKAHPDYLDFHTYTFVPDELFFHTIIGNNPEFFAKTKDSVTYVDWVSCGPFRPATFDMSYYDELMNRKELFARKFDRDVDSLILDRLDEAFRKETECTELTEKG